MAEMKHRGSQRVRQFGIGSALGLVLAAQLFLFLPFTLYLVNSGEFSLSFVSLFASYAPVAIGVLAAVSAGAWLVPGRWRLPYLSTLALLNLLLWLQGNLLVWDYGLFDGRQIDWSAYAGRSWFELGIWVGGPLLVASSYRSFAWPLIWAALTLGVLQTAILGYNWHSHRPAQGDRRDPGDEIRAHARGQMPRFSSERNVVHIIADGLQSDIFADLLREGDPGSGIRAELEGFTFFRDNLGVFPYTHMTIPAILSGEIYRNRQTIKEHMARAVGGETILSAFQDAGYAVDLVVPTGGVTSIYRSGHYDHFFQLTEQHHLEGAGFAAQEAAKLADLTLFRAAPHLLKRRIYNDQRWLLRSRYAERKDPALSFFSHTAYLRELAARMTADRNEPVYKLIHVMLSHDPMVTTADCEYAGQVLPTVRVNATNQSRCGLRDVVNLLGRMKELGIYDSATIVLMGDHGVWVPPLGLKAVPNADGKTASVINPALMALSVPVLAVKRPGDRGPLAINHAPAWIVDTAATIADSAGLPGTFGGISVFRLDPDEPRERRQHFYHYKRSEWNDDYLSPIEEFVVDGNVLDSASWRYETTHHPGGESRRSNTRSWVWQEFRIR